jgi:hypothetical protein
MYKHYIRINEDDEIIRTFCNIFETPQEGDILFKETEERHFNKSLINDDGFYKYIYDISDNTITKRTDDQIYANKLPEYKVEIIKKIKRKAFNLLLKTDWQVIRHRDQLDNGITTALTSQEYDFLLNSRQTIRNTSSVLEAQVLGATSRAEILALL